MTTAAMVFGVIPLVIASGGGCRWTTSNGDCDFCGIIDRYPFQRYLSFLQCIYSLHRVV
jgi:multidrug efflux pump subunit AcrB